MGNTAGPVQSIDRVFDIMELLSATPQGMLLSDVAEATGLHVSTVHRLLASLVGRGYAVKDAATGRYRLTLRLFEIGSRVSGVNDLLTVARPLLDEFSHFSQEAVHLVERDGNDVVYLYKAEPFQQSVRMSSCVGRRNPMYCTGVGKSILALLPEAEVDKIWRTSDIRPFTEKTIVDLHEMRRQLDQIRRSGYAFDDEEHEPGVQCIAAAIRNWAGQPVAAVSLSAPVFRMGKEVMDRILPRLLEITDQISRQLGQRPESV